MLGLSVQSSELFFHDVLDRSSRMWPSLLPAACRRCMCHGAYVPVGAPCSMYDRHSGRVSKGQGLFICAGGNASTSPARIRNAAYGFNCRWGTPSHACCCGSHALASALERVPFCVHEISPTFCWV